MKRTALTYLGGPLDGQEASAGRSLYRDNDGRPLPVQVGDREWCRGRGARQFYARRGAHYVHATVARRGDA
jgi:hypothetical protein